MRIVLWGGAVLIALIAVLGAVFWDASWARDLRCRAEGGVRIGQHCHDGGRGQVALRAEDAVTAEDYARLADLAPFDTLTINAENASDGFEAYPPLPDLERLYVEIHGREAPAAIDLRGIDRFAPAETFSFRDVTVMGGAALDGVEVETLTFENAPVDALPDALPALKGARFTGAVPETLDFALGAPELRWLTMSGPVLPDLAPIAELSRLTELVVSTDGGTGLEDLGPIGAAATLERLFLSGGGLGDLAPLAGLDALTVLSLGRAEELDLAPLGALRSLGQLTLFEVARTDLSALDAAPALGALRLVSSGDVEGLSSGTLADLLVEGTPRLILSRIGAVPALARLTVEDVPLVRLAGMPAMPDLVFLGIEGAEDLDLTGLAEAAPALERLDLRAIPNLDLSALDGLADLRTLIVTWAPATPPDLSALPELRALSLSGVTADVLAPLRGGPIETLDLDDIDWGDGAVPFAALLPLPELRALDIGQGVVDAETLAALPLLESVRAYDTQGRRVSLSGRGEIEAWIGENR